MTKMSIGDEQTVESLRRLRYIASKRDYAQISTRQSVNEQGTSVTTVRLRLISRWLGRVESAMSGRTPSRSGEKWLHTSALCRVGLTTRLDDHVGMVQ